jgi:predicted permease
MVGNVEPFLMVLLAAVGFLLLIACANVGNLLLARSMGRSREFALRAALGAGQWRVLRQLVTESVLLSGVGGALGLLLASFGVQAVGKALSGTLPRVEEVSLDGRVLWFTLGVSVFAALVSGLAPALQGARVNLVEILKEGGRGSTGGRSGLQRTFVAVEVAMALVLLVGTGLMLRSLRALWRVNLGFTASHAITFSLSIPATPRTTSAETRARLRRLDEVLGAVPGVQAVSVTLGSRPMIHDSSLPFWVAGRPKPANENEMPQAMFYLVEGGFQQAMGITLQRGRWVTPQDNENAALVIDIDDVFARTYFPRGGSGGEAGPSATVFGGGGDCRGGGTYQAMGTGWGCEGGDRGAVLLSVHAASGEVDADGGERGGGGAADGGRSGGGDGAGSEGGGAARFA